MGCRQSSTVRHSGIDLAGEQAGLIAGFKFLGLIDEAGNTLPIL